MAIDDENRAPDDKSPSEDLSEGDVRDLAMREALGLLDHIEAEVFEQAFESMTPDDQAAVLDLQAAVSREIAGAGVEEPDRSLRYRVLARLTEEMAADPASRGPLAVIGEGGVREARHRHLASVSTELPRVSELEFARIQRSAAVWRVAAFALGSALLALGIMSHRMDDNLGFLMGRLGDQAVTAQMLQVIGEELDLDRYLAQQTAATWSLVPGAGGSGTGFVLADSKVNKAGVRGGLLVTLKLPEVSTARILAVLPDGSTSDLGIFDLGSPRELSAFKLDLTDLPLELAFQVRDAATGVVLLRTA